MSQAAVSGSRWRRLADWWTPRLSPSPDFGSTPRLLGVAVLIWLVVCLIMVRQFGLNRGMGDTDDAMRLVIVRDLIAGRGWYDQLVTRVAPPGGFYPHWSRLLDGGLAGAQRLLELFMTRPWAEWAMRHFWPMAWVLPGLIAALAMARNLGGRSAVLVTAPLLLLQLGLYRQFAPGRIDHHNIQIVMTVAALACATARREKARWAAVGGLAAALGLAIGLEALMFQAVIGAAFGLELARDRKAAAPAAAYGVALAAGSLAFFLIQTPPWRWSLSVCDALGPNLTAALVTAGLGLAGCSAVASRVGDGVRRLALAVAGFAAGAVYLALDPACIHGPFAGMDPIVKAFWFDHIQEVQTIPQMLRIAYSPAIIAIATMAMTVVAGLWLAAREAPAPSSGALVTALCLLVAAATAWLTWRMQDYVGWLGIPAIGALYSHLGRRWLRDLMVPSVVLAVVVSPAVVGVAAGDAANAVTPPPKATPDIYGRCFDARAFKPLARLRPGVVMASQDLGSFILYATPHKVLIAPYHRLWPQILAVHRAFNAPPSQAEAKVRRLAPDYIVDCPGYPTQTDSGSFAAKLRENWSPNWLERVSLKGAVLQIYRLRPAGSGPISVPAGA